MSGPRPLVLLTGATGYIGGRLLRALEAQGRPVGVITDAAGGLLVADDVGNVIWRVSAQ